MSDTPTEAKAVISESDIAAALKEYETANDRVACIAKYPFLVEVLNNKKKK